MEYHKYFGSDGKNKKDKKNEEADLKKPYLKLLTFLMLDLNLYHAMMCMM